MLRIVKTPDGMLKVDPSGRQPGRGAYVCVSETCLAAARQRDALSKALRTRVDPSLYEELLHAIRKAKTEEGRPDE